MLTIAFFGAVFTSVVWLIYALLYVNSKLPTEGFFGTAPAEMLTFVAVTVLPALVIWLIFGLISLFINNKIVNAKQSEILKQLYKNQDYTDLVVRVMLDAEHEIKDGFVINKFDTFIADMNESLGEVIQRCNIASSAQMEQLWQRVRRGEKWALGKAVLDASKSQSTFNAWVKEKIGRDKVFKGSLLEFCSRYQNLLQLLEKHDRDRIFLRIIETGVFGKVYSIIAPLSEGIVQTPEIKVSENKTSHNNDYTSVLKLATMQDPHAGESIINVDSSEEDDTFEQNQDSEKKSFFSRLNPFKKSAENEIYDEDTEEEAEPDPFFKALQNSFGDADMSDDNSEPRIDTAENNDIYVKAETPEPVIMSDDEPEEKAPSFGSAMSAISNLRSTNDSFSSLKKDDFSFSDLRATKNEPMISENTNSLANNRKSNNSDDEDDLVYPFGGWTDEENYHR